ncbi:MULTISPECIES: DUF1223 domain-containing protein [Pseudovibrio]|uniref:DUF1223 domain-containing protein n=1 Tax=Stappiaceae TaxID=2821832 RepID=UPI0023660CBE|nr:MULTISPECIES: DUF1223 domain-containing protein [Pseudovibrio]MDD7909445.1 DUF1223 domain-containing protein [Pseudovibrio exalbescens]MDX5595004.1 DUF1223 domain-containing protein [Pseudovibrio sp. SPO723]
MVKRILVLGAVFAGISIAPAVHAAEAQKPKAIVELFTSQGCSSCPPADDILSELADKDGILALAFHVDYWDYLGWADTFGSADNTKRQKMYAEANGERSIYTPQMVVNGHRSFVGSDRASIKKALERHVSLPLSVETSVHDNMFEVSVDGAVPGPKLMASVYLVKVSDRATVSIRRGENAGSKREYRNVVRGIMPIGVWDGGPETYKLPLSEVGGNGVERIVVLVQKMVNGNPSDILGVATTAQVSF